MALPGGGELTFLLDRSYRTTWKVKFFLGCPHPSPTGVRSQAEGRFTGMVTDQADPPRDPRSQSERRRRVSIQTPPTQDEVPEGQILVPFAGRPFFPDQLARSHSSQPVIIQSWSHARIHINKEGQPTMVGNLGFLDNSTFLK